VGVFASGGEGRSGIDSQLYWGMIKITLTQGQVAFIDDEHAELAELKWYALWSPKTRSYYANRHVPGPDGKQNNQSVHRAVMELHLGRQLLRTEMIDHQNHDTLDNRLENLRLATNAENQRNRRKQITNTSGFKGVSWFRSNGDWRACIRINNKTRHLGGFDDIHQAAFAYDLAALERDPVFSETNFPAAAYGLALWPANDNSR
jgi:hypothetical protein